MKSKISEWIEKFEDIRTNIYASSADYDEENAVIELTAIEHLMSSLNDLASILPEE